MSVARTIRGEIHVTDAVSPLPASRAPQDAAASLRASLKRRRMKIVVIDDDPTGTQVASGVPVVTAWGDDDLRWALTQDAQLSFVVTNSRSMSEARATEINRDIGERLVRLGAESGTGVCCVSRSDSTLRGHFPSEVDALIEGLTAGGTHIDGTVLCPAFLSAGRVTINNVHYVRDGHMLIPVAETEFARDQTFGYTQSNLVEWVVARGVPRASVRALELAELRVRGPAYVVEQLKDLGGGVAIANAAHLDDLQVLALGIDQLEQAGRHFVYRTGPSFPAVRAGLEFRPPLAPADIGVGAGPGLVVVGSHTQLTTTQLEVARREHSLAVIELRVDQLEGSETEVRRCAQELRAALRVGDATLVSSRQLLAGASSAESLEIARRVADALVEVVRALPSEQPLGWVVAKGGITSSDIAARAFSARRAHVLGQIFDNLVSVWRLGAGSTRPGIPFVVFPGNVGKPDGLSVALQTLKASGR
jgi:uncharacterized protein YgbK (DUF1537 family)